MDRYKTETVVPTLPVPATGEGASRCGDALVLVRLDGTVGSWDGAAAEIFGPLPEEGLGGPFCTLFTAGCRDDVDGLIRAAQSDPLRTLATALDADGVPFVVEITSSRTLGVQNGAAGVVEVIRDVTEPRLVAASLLACAGPPDRECAIAALDEALGCWIPYRELTLGVVENNQRYRHPTRGEPAALDALHGHDSRDPGSPIHRV